MRSETLTIMRDWFNSLLSLFFPHCCLICGGALAKGEECLCACCNIDLPRTHYHKRKENPVEQLFWGKIPLERATSYFFYRRGGNSRHILYPLKYNGQKEIGETMGRYMAAELLASGFFESIDLIVPVPLHKKKQKLRGYNQSEWLARGVSAITAIPVCTSGLVREKNTETQTHKSVLQRWENVNGIFHVTSPENFIGKHILIIDDVLTTGATTVACASALATVERSVRISVLTLAVAE